MLIIETDKLSPNQINDILNLCENKEIFQEELKKEQNFVLAIYKNKVVGFLSFYKNYTLTIDNIEFRGLNYISHILLDSKFIELNVIETMYDILITKNINIATTVLSNDLKYINILEKLGFRLFDKVTENENINKKLYYIKTIF